MRLLHIVVLLFLSAVGFAQVENKIPQYTFNNRLGVGRFGNNDTTAWLHVGSTQSTKGVRLPRVLDTASVVGNKGHGLLIWSVQLNTVAFWDSINAVWSELGSGGGGSNFANADLTFTGDRTHDLDGKYLEITDSEHGSISLLNYPQVGFAGPFMDHRTLYDSSILIQAGKSATAATTYTESILYTDYDNALGSGEFIARFSAISGRRGHAPFDEQYASSFEVALGTNPLVIFKHFDSDPDSNALLFPISATTNTGSFSLAYDTTTGQIVRIPSSGSSDPTAIIDNHPYSSGYSGLDMTFTAFVYQKKWRDSIFFNIDSNGSRLTGYLDTASMRTWISTFTTSGGSDTLYYANRGASGVTLIHGSNDSIYINRLIAGTNITLTKGTDSAVTIAAAGAVPGGIHNSIQFNDAGAFNGFAQLFYDPATDKFWLSNTIRYPEGQSRYTIADSSSETGVLTNAFHIHQYSTGDPLIGFSVGSSISSPANSWVIGIDNSVSGDPLKFSPSANMGSGTSQSLTLNSGGTGGYGTGTPNTLYKWTLEKNTSSGGVISTPSLHSYALATWDGAGSVAAGWGLQNDFAIESSTGTVRIFGSQAYILLDPTNASEDAYFTTSVMKAGTLTENFRVDNFGKITLPASTNNSVGTATLVGGTVTVNNTSVTASSKIFITRAVTGGTTGQLSIGTITAGTSFVINSESGTETSQINFWIVN